MNLIITPSGFADWNGRRLHCGLGSGGISKIKCEGDGITPAGVYPLRQVFFRPDRIKRPSTVLPVSALTELDGWSDDPEDPRYNQQIGLPSKNHYEALWRTDSVYDLIATIGYNDRAVIPGAGSAIFLHVAKTGYTPTQGCITFPLLDLTQILNEWAECSQLDIRA